MPEVRREKGVPSLSRRKFLVSCGAAFAGILAGGCGFQGPEQDTPTTPDTATPRRSTGTVNSNIFVVRFDGDIDEQKLEVAWEQGAVKNLVSFDRDVTKKLKQLGVEQEDIVHIVKQLFGLSLPNGYYSNDNDGLRINVKLASLSELGYIPYQLERTGDEVTLILGIEGGETFLGDRFVTLATGPLTDRQTWNYFLALGLIQALRQDSSSSISSTDSHGSSLVTTSVATTGGLGFNVAVENISGGDAQKHSSNELNIIFEAYLAQQILRQSPAFHSFAPDDWAVIANLHPEARSLETNTGRSTRFTAGFMLWDELVRSYLTLESVVEYYRQNAPGHLINDLFQIQGNRPVSVEDYNEFIILINNYLREYISLSGFKAQLEKIREQNIK